MGGFDVEVEVRAGGSRAVAKALLTGGFSPPKAFAWTAQAADTSNYRRLIPLGGGWPWALIQRSINSSRERRQPQDAAPAQPYAMRTSAAAKSRAGAPPPTPLHRAKDSATIPPLTSSLQRRRRPTP